MLLAEPRWKASCLWPTARRGNRAGVGNGLLSQKLSYYSSEIRLPLRVFKSRSKWERWEKGVAWKPPLPLARPSWPRSSTQKPERERAAAAEGSRPRHGKVAGGWAPRGRAGRQPPAGGPWARRGRGGPPRPARACEDVGRWERL